MSGFPGCPRLLKGGIVLIDAGSAQVQRIISLQYNPDSLTRTLQPQGPGEGADRAEALRLKGPAVETFKLEAEIDATDQLEFPDQNKTAVEFGIQPQLAVLESLVHPPSSRLIANNALANAGTLEIGPMESPLALFVWSKSRIVPVRVTDFRITARLNVASGHIRNVALNAASLASEEGQPVRMPHLLQAARAEAAKRERSLTDSETRGWV